MHTDTDAGVTVTSVATSRVPTAMILGLVLVKSRGGIGVMRFQG